MGIKKTTYKGPQIKFTFADLLKKEKINLNLYETYDAKLKKYYVNFANPLKDVMVKMINDIVSDKDYNNLNHMVKKNNIKKRNKESIALIHQEIKSDSLLFKDSWKDKIPPIYKVMEEDFIKLRKEFNQLSRKERKKYS